MMRWQTSEKQKEPRPVSEFWLRKLSAFVTERMGLRFPRERWGDLERGLRSAAGEFGFEDLEACAQWMVSSRLSKEQTETLASYLTVGETYFLRDKAGFDALERRILPELIQSRRGRDRRLKIWSAGCCTGEEAYSIAILLDRAIPDLREWRIDIIAVDINTSFLEKASRGVYSEWSFRQTPDWVRGGYFRKRESGKFEILPHIKALVDFEYLNLAEDVYPSFLNNLYAVDVIICCNVLMYFGPRQAEKVLSGFFRSLVDGGWLIVGANDLLHVKVSEFALVDSKRPNLYRKDLTAASGRQGPQQIDSVPPFDVPTRLEAPSGSALKPQPEAEPPQEVAVSLPRDTKGEVKAPQEQPPEDDGRYAEALKLYEDGHYEETAGTLLRWLSDATPGSHEPGYGAKQMTLLARAYANQGNLDEALVWCDRAIGADKVKPGAHYLRANILQEQGRIEKAASSLRQALFLDPGFVLGHFTLGNLARSRGKMGESKKHFANALGLLSGQPEDAIVPESEGITVGRLTKTITSITERRS